MSEILTQLFQGIKILQSRGLETGSSGNISVRLEDGNIAIKPSGLAYSNVSHDNISIVSPSGLRQVGGIPSTDLPSHIAIYNLRPDLGCIIHTHAHFCTVWATTASGLPVLSSMHADYFGTNIRCASYINHRDRGFGHDVAFETNNVILLARHGAVCVGPNVNNAIERLLVLEEVARLAFDSIVLAKSLDIPIAPLEQEHGLECKEWFRTKYGQTGFL